MGNPPRRNNLRSKYCWPENQEEILQKQPEGNDSFSDIFSSCRIAEELQNNDEYHSRK